MCIQFRAITLQPERCSTPATGVAGEPPIMAAAGRTRPGPHAALPLARRVGAELGCRAAIMLAAGIIAQLVMSE